MSEVNELIDSAISEWSGVKLVDANAAVDVLLDIRNALGRDDGQEDHQTETEGSPDSGVVPNEAVPEVLPA